jgi:hypothetical protein
VPAGTQAEKCNLPEIYLFDNLVERRQMAMEGFPLRFVIASLVSMSCWAQSAQDQSKEKQEVKVVVTGTAVAPPAAAPRGDSTTEGTVKIGSQVIEYRAVAGALTVGATDT